MEDPMTTPCSHTFYRVNISKDLQDQEETCPTCRKPVRIVDLTSNIALRDSNLIIKNTPLKLLRLLAGRANQDDHSLSSDNFEEFQQLKKTKIELLVVDPLTGNLIYRISS